VRDFVEIGAYGETFAVACDDYWGMDSFVLQFGEGAE
jgi:hypothetical protein